MTIDGIPPIEPGQPAAAASHAPVENDSTPTVQSSVDGTLPAMAPQSTGGEGSSGITRANVAGTSPAKLWASQLQGANPLVAPFNTPHGVPPFSQIKAEHYRPAIDEGFAAHKAEIAVITGECAEATFANTIEAFERSGGLLSRVASVFFNITNADTTKALQAIENDVAPLFAQHDDDIFLNDALFARIKAVFDKRDGLGLSSEQTRLLELTHRDFVRNGANLDPTAKASLRVVNERLAVLSTKFSENALAETNAFSMLLDDSDLIGLPQDVRQAAADLAKAEGKAGYLFNLQRPSMAPFLQYSERRDLRKKVYQAYVNRCADGGAHDNRKIASEMAAMRAKRSNILGYETHAHYVLEENMAKTPDTVQKLLGDLWTRALPRAQDEIKKLQGLIDEEGGGFAVQAWDWSFYADKVRQKEFALDEAEVKPYLSLDGMREAAFEVAHRLYGVTFSERTDIPSYHDEATPYEVKAADGSHIGVFFMDFHPRSSKRSGAWMDALRKQSARGGEAVTPIVVNVCNFSRATGDQPALLNFEEATTLFHEFGHALHGLMSDCEYEALSGTAVAGDFVELPSQIMENWVSEPAFLREFARHFETGEPMPQALIDKLEAAKHFNQGFATVEYLAASLLDMAWHTQAADEPVDAAAFEKEFLDSIGLPEEIGTRYRSPYFSHIFAGGYASGYYGYIWAEVLDADGFGVFKENGLYDKATAAKLLEVISSGNTREPSELFKVLRGRDPKIDAVLERRGL